MPVANFETTTHAVGKAVVTLPTKTVVKFDEERHGRRRKYLVITRVKRTDDLDRRALGSAAGCLGRDARGGWGHGRVLSGCVLREFRVGRHTVQMHELLTPL